jgi:hypothetical protein
VDAIQLSKIVWQFIERCVAGIDEGASRWATDTDTVE